MGRAVVLILAVLAALPATAGAVDAPALERRAQAFYDLLTAGRRAQAEGVWAPLERDLAAAVERLQDDLDQMREDVIDRDGDLDALYKSARWREPEVASLVLTYHLAWVRYQGAQLVTDKQRRAALLRAALEGFSSFTIVDDVPEIYAESLYGRGLAFMDLGEHAKAIADLEAAAGLSRTAAKAKPALAEARRLAGGGRQAPPEPTPEDLLAKLGPLLPAAARGDAGADKEASDLARGLAARGRGWPEKVIDTITRTLGDGSPATVRSSYGLALLGQLAVDRQRCGDLPALVAASERADDAGRARHRPALLYLHAGCTHNAGDTAKAAALFGALLDEYPNAAVANDAAYYRFRALDAEATSDPDAVRAAGEAYLARFGREGRAGGVRVLLGERLRAAGDCDAARALYDAVTTGSEVPRARLGALECDVAALGTDATPEDRRRVADALAAFAASTNPEGEAAQSVARAVLLAALVLASGPEPDHAKAAATLADFERRFPKQTTWHAMARETRLQSAIRAGSSTGVEADVDALLAEPVDRHTATLLARVATDLAGPAARDPDPAARELARRIWAALAADGTDPAARLRVAALELDAGNAAEARRLYEAALADDPDSSEARRGAAHAATAAGDSTAALAHWRAIVEQSPTGGTAWYEARLAQVDLLAASDQRTAACELLRRSRGFATTTGGDVLEAQLRAREPEICH